MRSDNNINRMKLARTALAILLLAFASGAAAGEARVFPDAASVSNETTCFTGEWSDEDRFLASLVSRNAALESNQEARARAVAYYRDIRATYECRWFDYEVDGHEVRGFITLPIQRKSEKLPVIIFNRGGNADGGAFPSPYIFGRFFPVVKEGFVIIGSMYRGARIDGKPSPDRLADEFGGEDVNDVLALLPIIDTLPFVNGKNIGIWGVSRGGMMAYLASLRTDRFRAVVAEATPVDLMSSLEDRPEMEAVFKEWIPGYGDAPDEVLRRRSALYWADEIPEALPVLIMHGTVDERVRPMQALRMAAKLQEISHPYRLVMFEGQGHALDNRDVTQEVVRWFSRKLGTMKTPTRHMH